MNAAQQGTSDSRRIRLRGNWMPIVLTVVGVLLVSMVGYFALQYLRGSAFQEERAFRVLGEVSKQFDNMQETLGSLLTLVPESLLIGDCGLADTGDYIAKLKLTDLNLKRFAAKNPISGDRFDVATDDPRRPFTVHTRAATRSGCSLQITGTLQQHLPAFVAQRYFDEVLLTLQSGEVLGTVSNRGADPARADLHPDTSIDRPVADARLLLLRAAAESDAGRTSDFWNTQAEKHEPLYQQPFHSVAFRQSIGGHTYVVSVLPIIPSYAVRVDATKPNGGELRESQALLYLIGLKRQHLGQQATDALGPAGTLTVTTLVLLGILLWPFIGLRLAIRHSAISGFQVFAIIVSLLLIPVVLTACGVWLWNDLRLRVWADRGAEHYAADIERSLRNELEEGVLLLDAYRDLANSPAACTSAADAPVRLDPQTRKMALATIVRNPGGADCKIFLQSRPAPADPLGNWSPIRTAVALDAAGTSMAPRITAFGNVPVKSKLDVRDRAYFRSLSAGQQWMSRDDHGEPVPFVAQRLFNRSDAARTLQLAIPRTRTPLWQGAMIGDTRVYGLTAGIRPPLLRFAVVDRANGEVLFHSDDERSLAENLLTETDDSTALRQALSSGGWAERRIALEDHFSTQYVGEPHRFYYRSMAGVPWGVVVYYPTRTLSDISLDATIATLATCIGFVTLIALLLVATAFFGSIRPDRHLLSCIWPQWEWRHHYPRIAIALTCFGAILIAGLIYGLRHGHGWIIGAVITMTGVLIALLFARVAVIAPRTTTPRAYRAFYAWAVVAFIGVVVVTPTAMLAFRYQDISMQGYLRNALTQSASDVNQRRRLMQSDLARWVPDASERHARYPDGWTLARLLPVPGFRNEPGAEPATCSLWSMTVFPDLPWIDADGPARLDMIRRTIWRVTTATSPEQRRSVRSTAGGADSQLRCAFAAPAGPQDAANRPAAQRLLRTEDDRIIRIRFEPSAAGAIPASNEDVIHRDRWWSTWNAALLSLGLLFVLVVLVANAARRLFGIYLPFGARHVELAPKAGFPFDELLETELKIDQLRAQLGERFTDKDAADLRRIHCTGRYQQLWATLSADERHLLHQLAMGQFANPENTATIESLLYKRYIRLRPWPVINDQGFADFARSAPELEQFSADRRQWAREEAESTWNRVRKPLLLIGVLLAIGLMALAGTTMQIVSTALAAITALLGSVTQVTNFVRKDGGS